MVRTFRSALEFHNALAEMAEELRLKIIPLSDVERTELVTRLIADQDMVFGVWPDADEPNAFGVQVIKGEGLMPPLEGFDLPEEVTVAALPCIGPEQAIAARDAWGGTDDEDALPEVDAPSSARAALSVAEATRLVWAAGRWPDANERSEPA
jgi:hypothetical protein